MTVELDKLKENDLRKYSYEDTKEVIRQLEEIWVSNFNGINAYERIETYYAFANLIKNRISNDEFSELRASNKRGEKNRLYSTLLSMLSSFKYSLEVAKLQKRVKKAEDEKRELDFIIGDVKKQLETTVEDYNAKKEVLEKEVYDVGRVISGLRSDMDNKAATFSQEVGALQKRIDDSEHTILTHVLTLMGVFSAVITIIMSVVITSSSWLNNSDGASAITAFTVPNLVALLAVVVLLSLMFLYNNAVNTVAADGRKQTKTIIFFGAVLAIIIILTCFIAWNANSSNGLRQETHTRHIVSSAEYRIVNEIVDSSGKIEYYYEFCFEGNTYKILYDERLSHDGNLYLCSNHNKLE